MIRKRGNNSKTGESSKLLLYYCAIVKCMCLFFDQLTAICPIRYLGDSLQFLRIWYLVLHHTAYRPNVTQHWLHLYCLPEALWARAIRKKDAIWCDHQQRRASSMDTKTTSTPATPIPIRVKGRNDHLFVLCEHSLHALRLHCTAEMYREKRDH